MTFSISCTVLLALLVLLHVYWSVGGQRLLPQTVPSRPGTGQRAFDPGRLGAAVVAAALGHALYTLGTLSGLWEPLGSGGSTRYAALVWTAIFALRVVGDFRFLGLSKRVRGTAFARADNWVFTPVCALLGIAFGLAAGGPG